MISSLVMLGLFTALQAGATDFDSAAPENDVVIPPGYTEAQIQKQIQDEMQVSCKGNLCQIVGQDNQGSGWTVSFNVGTGQNNNTGTGSNIFIGSGDHGFNNGNGEYAGITIAYKTYKCSSQMNVTPAVYRFVQTYMYNMVNADGSPKRNFTPADQTVILFYTTMLQKVEGCRSSGGNGNF